MVCRFQQKTMHCGQKMFVINVAEHSGWKKELHSFPYHTKQGLAKTSGKRRSSKVISRLISSK